MNTISEARIYTQMRCRASVNLAKKRVSNAIRAIGRLSHLTNIAVFNPESQTARLAYSGVELPSAKILRTGHRWIVSRGKQDTREGYQRFAFRTFVKTLVGPLPY